MFRADLDLTPPASLAFDPSEPLADFCLWPYAPLATGPGLLKSEAMLWAASRLDPAGDRLLAAISALKTELGPMQTVWGIKHQRGRLSYELYFYDYEREARSVSPERVFGALEGMAHTRMILPRSRPYFMFSFDVTPQGLAAGEEIGEVSYYVGNPSTDVSSGLCYKLDRTGLHFANLYHFFHTATHREEIARKLSASAYLDQPLDQLAALLQPDRLGAITVVANKRGGDGLYYARVRAPQMAAFLARHGFPEQLVGFSRANVARLAHLHFDLGLDYAIVDGRVDVIKTAIYGVA